MKSGDSRRRAGLGAALRTVDQFLDLIATVMLRASEACLAAILVMNILNIGSRALFDIGLKWVFPWSIFLFVWMIFLGFYPVQRRGRDVTVGFIVDLGGPAARRAAEVLAALVALALMGVILFKAPALVAAQTSRIEMVGLDRYFLSLPLILSAGLIFVHALTELGRLVAGRGPSPHSGPEN